MSKEPKKFATVEAAKIALISALIVAVFGAITAGVNAYANYMSNRVQIELPILATQTAEARLTEVSGIFNMTQSAIVPSATLPPSLTNTETPTPTFTPTITPSPTLLPSKTPTKSPTSTPTIAPIVFRGLDKNCISKTYWNPTPVFPSDNLTLDKNSCWNLTSWGIISENQSLKFVVSNDIINERVTRSIYTTLGNNVVIEFNINVKALASASDMDGVVFIGLGNKTSYAEPGYFLKYIVLAKETKPYFVFAPDYFNYYIPKIEYSFGDIQAVKIVINGSDVSIQLGNEVKRLTLLPSKREVLWIGYSTPASNVNVVISEFRIYDK
jgi:hypothetical protein